MVHALNEARRVLKPDGVLIDLRPAPVHRRVGIVRGRRWEQLGVMRERFDEDRAANRAVGVVLGAGGLRRVQRMQFECPREMDTLDEFQRWLDEFVSEANLTPHDWLVKRVTDSLAAKGGAYKIVVRGPLILQVLAKAGEGARRSHSR